MPKSTELLAFWKSLNTERASRGLPPANFAEVRAARETAFDAARETAFDASRKQLHNERKPR